MANPLLKFPAPRILLKQVYDSAPWLRQAPGPWLGPEWESIPHKPSRPLLALADHPLGWFSILQAAKGWQRFRSGDGGELLDYAALALACHHASVATYVPTDVDSKIRGHIWRIASTPGLVKKLAKLAMSHCQWDNKPCSARWITTEHGRLSGHDGERLSVMVAALASIEKAGLVDESQQFRHWIEHEIQREANCWQWCLQQARVDASPPQQQQLGACALYLAHNAGDIDQGLQAWPKGDERFAATTQWGQLCKRIKGTEQSDERYQGAFQQAARYYRRGMSAEAHRHYPLREIDILRREQAFLLPCPPFLRDWGRCLATHPSLSNEERTAVIMGLLHAIERVPGQRAYQQALVGLVASLEQSDAVLRALPPSQFALLKRGTIADDMAMTAAELMQALGLAEHEPLNKSDETST